MFGRIGIEGAVVQCLTHGLPLVEPTQGGRTETGLLKALPDVFHCLVGGMEHVLAIETIVAKLVVHYLVGREIVETGEWRVGYAFFRCEKECGFGELALVVTIFSIADGAYGEYDMDIGIHRKKQPDCLHYLVGSVVHREFLFLKQPRGTLLTVIHYLACFLEPIDMVCT